jgi:hypothetical protein
MNEGKNLSTKIGGLTGARRGAARLGLRIGRRWCLRQRGSCKQKRRGAERE